MTPSPLPQDKKAGPLIAAGLLLLVGLASMITQYLHHKAAPLSADWERAARTAVELAEPLDALRVHPSWTEEPLPHLLPVGNLLHRQHHPLLEDFTGLERVLILTETRRKQQALERLPFPVKILSTQKFGTVSLLVAMIPDNFQIPSDLTSSLSSAKVFIKSESEQRRCTARPGSSSFRCPTNSKTGVVEPTTLEIEHDGRRCIQAFPPAQEATLTVEIPLENPADILRVRAGLDQRAARLEKGDDIVYRVYLDEELIAEQLLSGHTSTWKAHDVDTRALDTDSPTLRVEVQSIAPQPHHRRFCFNAWTLTTEQAAQKSTR